MATLADINPRTGQPFTSCAALRLHLYKIEKKNKTRAARAEQQAELNAQIQQSLKTFNPPTPYSTLPLQTYPFNHTPADAPATLLSRIFTRAATFTAKNAPQELSLLFHLFTLTRHRPNLTILDVGGGNANLSCLIALVLDVDVVCIERTAHRTELRAETCMPPAVAARITRVDADIRDYTQPPNTTSIVLAKHLCGLGTDYAIDYMRLTPCVGCVLATCCCCKIASDAPAFQRMYASCGAADADRLARATSWRNVADDPARVATAETCEGVFNGLRQAKLKALGFADTREVRFCDVGTPQNRLLVAGGEGPTIALVEEFFGVIERRIGALAEFLPIDLRPNYADGKEKDAPQT